MKYACLRVREVMALREDTKVGRYPGAENAFMKWQSNHQAILRSKYSCRSNRFEVFSSNNAVPTKPQNTHNISDIPTYTSIIPS